MKKLFIGIVVLLSTSLMFAETSFWGISVKPKNK